MRRKKEENEEKGPNLNAEVVLSVGLPSDLWAVGKELPELTSSLSDAELCAAEGFGAGQW